MQLLLLAGNQADARNQQGATICMNFLDNNPVSLKARRQGRREGIQWHKVDLMQELETRSTINEHDFVNTFGGEGQDNDMSMDCKDVMPGHREGKENESRQEGRMGG